VKEGREEKVRKCERKKEWKSGGKKKEVKIYE
jgi:hypothetical protein